MLTWLHFHIEYLDKKSSDFSELFVHSLTFVFQTLRHRFLRHEFPSLQHRCWAELVLGVNWGWRGHKR